MTKDFKICTKCKVSKEIHKFHLKRKKPATICKDCVYTISKAYKRTWEYINKHLLIK